MLLGMSGNKRNWGVEGGVGEGKKMDRKQESALKGFMNPIRKFSLYPEGNREQIDPE